MLLRVGILLAYIKRLNYLI